MSHTLGKIHQSITVQRVMDAAQEEDYIGFCLYCGVETTGVEPDAASYHCDSCGMNRVFGAEILLFMGLP